MWPQTTSPIAIVSVPSEYSLTLSTLIVTFWFLLIVEIENLSGGTFGPPTTVTSILGASALISACLLDMNLSLRQIWQVGSVPMIVTGDSVNSSPRCGP